MIEKLKQIFSDALNMPVEQITDESSMSNIENWDSLSHLQLISSLEEAFGISFETDEIIQMTSFGIIKNILEKKK